MKKYFTYLKYLLTHKWYVMLECFRMRLFWTGIIHDWSKFLPSEFLPYARHVFKRFKTGYYKPTSTGDDAFDLAWFMHKSRNKHHWQYWSNPTETGLDILEMPDKYRMEMICDWIGAGKAQGKGVNTKQWWEANKNKMQFHPRTRVKIESFIKDNF